MKPTKEMRDELFKQLKTMVSVMSPAVKTHVVFDLMDGTTIGGVYIRINKDEALELLDSGLKVNQRIHEKS